MLQRRVRCPLLVQLCDYIEGTWLKHSIWSPENWSVFGQVVRTNNDLEGWHRRLNLKANDSKPPMYVLIRILQKEASLLPLHIQMVSEAKLMRRHREETKTTQAQLFSLWDQWEKDELTASQFLKLVGKSYGF
ncbi:uncharacterized protein LOC117328536 [Pecten maximus]|uniref:uncharacterized protein LOC117328536 n=1 Tax=Pecten maximus TaxID=6579 RepID=UPI00145875CF|nr:uncharacterized protein LOC117328536 [Pecten maximus]